MYVDLAFFIDLDSPNLTDFKGNCGLHTQLRRPMPPPPSQNQTP